MQIKLISGNFQAIINGNVAQGEVNVGTEKEPKLQPAQDVINECGLTYIGQRDGWTNFYKPRLTKGQERSELEFSDALALEVVKSLSETFSPYVEDISVEVAEHVPAEGASEMKRATTLVDSFLGTDKEAQWRGVLQAMGAPADASREQLIATAHESKLGISPERKKKEAKTA